MPSEQFSRSVRGSSGQAIATNASGTVETDNYTAAQKLNGSTYPLSANPSFTIQEWILLVNPGGKTVDLTLKDGSTVTGVPLGNATGAFDTLQVDSISINDAGGGGGETSIILVGE